MCNIIPTMVTLFLLLLEGVCVVHTKSSLHSAGEATLTEIVISSKCIVFLIE